jgi:hypothetical protein
LNDALVEKMMGVFMDGKRAMDALQLEIGKIVAETIRYKTKKNSGHFQKRKRSE